MRAAGLFLTLPQLVAGAASSQVSQTNPDADAIRRYCEKNGHQLAGLFTPGEGQQQADAYRELIGIVKARPALILVPDSRHLAHDLETLAARVLEIKETGSEIRCLDSQYPDIVLNGLERLGLRGPLQDRNKRVRKSILAKAARGEVLGRTPYGYSVGLDGQLKPVPEESDTVRSIFALYTGVSSQGVISAFPSQPPATTKQGQGIGLRRIANHLNGDGSRTRKGLPWTPVAIASILRNRAYAGVYARYGNFIGGAHQPIVDRTVFTQAQTLIQSRKPHRRGRSAEPFTLGGLVKCGVCGAGAFGLTRRRVWSNKDGAKQSAIYRYYECRARAPRLSKGMNSPAHPSWHAEDLEKQVRARIGLPVLVDLIPNAITTVPEMDGASGKPCGASVLSSGAASPAPVGSAVPHRNLEAAGRDFVQTLRLLTAGRARYPNVAAALATLRAAREGSRPRDQAAPLAAGVTALVVAPDMASLIERVVLYTDRLEVVMKQHQAEHAPAA